MKSRSIDLNSHLFEQLEWLGDRSIKGEELDEECKRAGSVVKVAEQIVANNALHLRAQMLGEDYLEYFKTPNSSVIGITDERNRRL